MRLENGEVRFAARFAEARRVQVAGDFNGWSAISTPLVGGDNGRWTAALPLPVGRYKYKFVVDGLWTNDPHNPLTETNEFGEMNNVVEVA